MSVFKITDNGATYYSQSIDSLAAGAIKKERLEKMTADQVAAVVTALGFETDAVDDAADLAAMSSTIRLLSSYLNQSRAARQDLALSLLNDGDVSTDYIDTVQKNCSVGWNVLLAWSVGEDGQPLVPEEVSRYIGEKKAQADAKREAAGKDGSSLGDVDPEDEDEDSPAF